MTTPADREKRAHGHVKGDVGTPHLRLQVRQTELTGSAVRHQGITRPERHQGERAGLKRAV